ncbi:MAG: hypothetical protein WD967_01400, partial [Candidatus Levyibacteriota bacterium]
MEVALLEGNSLKIRSKFATFIINPNASIAKTEGDAVITFGIDNPDTSRVSEFRTIISGPGEYEVKGIKITSAKSPEGAVYKLSLDKLDVVLGKASAISASENVAAAHIVIIETDMLPSDKVITSMQPSVVILYGEKSKEAAKAIKEGAGEGIGKFAVTFEKLP